MTAGSTEFGIESIRIALATKATEPSRLGFDLPEDYYQNVSGAGSLSVCADGEDAFQLSSSAAAKLFLSHPSLAAKLDAIFVVTLPTEPTVAPISSRLQAHLGAKPETFCLDLTLSCVGFLQASSVILDMARSRDWKHVLLLNVETLTKVIRHDDAPLRLIMSDGATATLFSQQPRVVFDQFEFFSDGTLAPILATKDGKMWMDGPRLYETVLRRIPESFRQALERFGLKREAIDLFLFHQGSRKVLDKLTERLQLDPAKVLTTIEETGNLGSCTLPVLLERVLRENSVGQFFATAFGAGFQWAHASLRQKG